MKAEDIFLVRTLLDRMKLAAPGNSDVQRLSDDLMTLVREDAPLPTMQYPDIRWVGETMVVR